eukprot:4272304-Amphidinium_carterae.1
MHHKQRPNPADDASVLHEHSSPDEKSSEALLSKYGKTAALKTLSSSLSQSLNRSRDSRPRWPNTVHSIAIQRAI